MASGDRVSVVYVATGKEMLRLRGHNGAVFCVMYSAAGKSIVTCGDDGAIVFHDAMTGEVRCRLFGHEGRVNDLSLAQNAHLLASAGDDGTVRLWPLASAAEVESQTSARPLVIDENEPGFANGHASKSEKP